jgi:hypothetical protein
MVSEIEVTMGGLDVERGSVEVAQRSRRLIEGLTTGTIVPVPIRQAFEERSRVRPREG